MRSWDVPISYTRTFGKLINTARVEFNSSRSQTQNLFAFSQNIAGNLGIQGISQNPFDRGVPNLSFTDVAGLTDVSPSLLRNQTFDLCRQHDLEPRQAQCHLGRGFPPHPTQYRK